MQISIKIGGECDKQGVELTVEGQEMKKSRILCFSKRPNEFSSSVTTRKTAQNSAKQRKTNAEASKCNKPTINLTSPVRSLALS